MAGTGALVKSGWNSAEYTPAQASTPGSAGGGGGGAVAAQIIDLRHERYCRDYVRGIVARAYAAQEFADSVARVTAHVARQATKAAALYFRYRSLTVSDQIIGADTLKQIDDVILPGLEALSDLAADVLAANVLASIEPAR